MVLDKDVFGRFNTDRLHLAFFFWFERAHFKIGKHWRRKGPLPAPSIDFVSPLKVCRKFGIKGVIVGESGKARRSLENTKQPACAYLPEAIRRGATLPDRQPAVRPVAQRGVLRRLAWNLAPAGICSSRCGALRLVLRECACNALCARLRLSGNAGRGDRRHCPAHPRPIRRSAFHLP